MNLDITNEDNMNLMARYPDKHFDLAIVDPPYGISEKIISGGNLNKTMKRNELIKWDTVPDKKYFTELFRVSKDQIIWGANYFTEHLTHSRGWIVWNKKLPDGLSYAKGELAFSSFNMNLDILHLSPGIEKKEHPTQKPVALYKWLLSKYAKPGQTILDTHLGSGSIALACIDLGFHLTACELDKDYYTAAMERIRNHQKQETLFKAEEIQDLLFS